MAEIIQCIVAYPSRTQAGSPAKFDMDYYLKTHMAMIDQYWGPHGMKRWRISEFAAKNPLTGSEMPYIVQTTIEWDSVDDLKRALSAPDADKTKEDIPKFTDVVPEIWVSKVAAAK
ncbi:hypothetical protein FE257_008983 [Aspergillus nanangensis]|uniref:EthD domain-containing protein n=1 Tax=Aspergillus nanangensis TaxID=2582783 RepID=A0AAD4GYH8_ASPNN|nr:hypothetical protein FE257_008983 [Aspergillus nanangensis]